MSLARHRFLLLLGTGLAAAGLLAGCGGGSDAETTPTVPDTPAATTTTVTGSVVKGPVNGASVCAYKATSTGKGEQLLCTTSNTTGGYTMDLTYVGDVVIEASGGTYTDEATGATTTLSEPMQVVLASQGGQATGVITPLTAAAFSVAKGLGGGVSSANFATAASSVAGQFQLGGINLATTVPVVTGSANAYGQILRAVSQFVANGNTLSSFVAFSSPTVLQAGFATAYATINGSSINFTFDGGSTGGTGGTGGDGGTGGTANKNLVVTVTVMGVSSTINVANVPMPTTQAEFCDGLAADTTFSQINAGGSGTMTINSCSFSGNTGNIAATLTITSPVTLSASYTIVYTYQ